MFNSQCWERRLGNFKLVESLDTTKVNPVKMSYDDCTLTKQFWFSSWGMERRIITQEYCFNVAEMMLHLEADRTILTFQECIEMAKTKTIVDPKECSHDDCCQCEPVFFAN